MGIPVTRWVWDLTDTNELQTFCVQSSTVFNCQSDRRKYTLDTVILTAADVRNTLTHVGVDAFMDEVIRRLEIECADNEAFSVPARDGFTDAQAGLVEWMPVMHESNLVTIKVVGYHADNPTAHGLPTILAVSSTFDMRTGHLLALSDSTIATAIRTGAASAVASRVLAEPSSSVLGLVGAGAQAVTQLHALSRLFPLQRVLVYDTNPAVSEDFARRARTLPGLQDLDVATASPQTIIQGADIICTATSMPVGAGPALPHGTFRPHVHINAVGSDFPGKFELAKATLEASFIVADYRPQALKEGECQQIDAQLVAADLSELIKGADQFSAKRASPTVFDSTGYALEDHVVIDYLHAAAAELGYGQRVEIEVVSEDPTHPYDFLHTSVTNGNSPG